MYCWKILRTLFLNNTKLQKTKSFVRIEHFWRHECTDCLFILIDESSGKKYDFRPENLYPSFDVPFEGSKMSQITRVIYECNMDPSNQTEHVAGVPQWQVLFAFAQAFYWNISFSKKIQGRSLKSGCLKVIFSQQPYFWLIFKLL